MILSGTVPTRVPEPSTTPTRVPGSTATLTRVPTSGAVPAVVPTSVAVRSRVPASVTVPTVRPPTTERILAMQTATVTGTALLRAIVAITAEQNTVGVGAAAFAMPTWGNNTTTVTGTAVVSATYSRGAAQAVTVTGTAVLAVRYTRPATQAVSVTATATLAVRYTIPATQAIATTSAGDVRASIDTDAVNDITTTSNGTSRVDGGTSVVTAYGTAEINGVAALAEIRTAAATQAATVTGSVSVTGVLIGRTATGTAAVTGTATLRAIYTRTAAQAIAVTETGAVGVRLTATNSIATTSTATTRAAYPLAATNSIGVTGSATTAVSAMVRSSSTGSTTTNTMNVAIPTGAAGDLLVLFIHQNGSGTAASGLSTTLAGWTQVDSQQILGGSSLFMTYTKVRSSSESDLALPMNSATYHDAVLLDLVGINTTTNSGLDAKAIESATSRTTTQQVPSVNATTQDIVIRVAGWVDNTENTLGTLGFDPGVTVVTQVGTATTGTQHVQMIVGVQTVTAGATGTVAATTTNSDYPVRATYAFRSI